MRSLVGYTGFVGKNLWDTGEYDKGYNTTNIEEAYGTRPDLLVYAGMRAQKFLANSNPDADAELIEEAFDNIQKISPRKLILISTIDVFKDPRGKDEASTVELDGLHPYGANRFRLELMVREEYHDAIIVRLPALFGRGLKKNLIYDYVNVIPAMLTYEKFEELSGREDVIKNYYERLDNGFYKQLSLGESEKSMLKEIFSGLGFTALNFTDSRSRFQFYPLRRLNDDLKVLLEKDIRLFHPATEPVSAGEVCEFLSGKKFENEMGSAPADYDYRTLYDDVFGGKDGYIMDKEQELTEIWNYVNQKSGM